MLKEMERKWKEQGETKNARKKKHKKDLSTEEET